MADSYRGLTIRIGADTEQLSRALKASTSAATAAESAIRKMQRALRDDPGSSNAMVRQVEEVGNKARDVSQRLSTLRDAYDQIADRQLKAFDGATVAEMAGQVQNAKLRVMELKDAYEAVVVETTKTYDSVRKLTGVGLSEDRKSANYIWSDSSIENLKRLNVQFDQTKDNADTIADKLAKLGTEGGGISQEMADHVHALRQSLSETSQELEDMRQVSSFKELSGDIDAASASVVDLTRRFVALSRESSIAKSSGFVEIRDQIAVLDPALENVRARLDRVNAALKLDPTNEILAAQKAELLASATDMAQEKATLLGRQLAMYDAAGVGRAADEMGNVSKAAEDSARRYQEVTAKVEELEGQLARARAEAEQLDRSDVSRLTKGGEEARERYDQLQSTISECEGKLRELKDEQEQAKQAFDTAQQCKEYEELKTSVGEAEVAVKDYQEAARNAGSTVQDSVSRQTSAWDSMEQAGRGLSGTVTQYLTQIGQYSIDAADTMDSAYRDMRKTVNGTDEQFVQLKGDAEAFASTHVTSADQVLEIQAMGGQLGIAADQLGAFSEVVSNLDVATNIDAQTVAQQLGQMNAVMPDLNNNFQAWGDSLTRLGNNAPALESDIVDISQRIGSQAALYKMSTPDVLGWATAVASTGQKSEAAGTAIANSFTKVNDYVNSGNETFYRLMSTSGMTADEIKAKWGTEGGTTEVMKAFIQSLSDAAERGENVDSILSDLGITGARQKQTLEGLTQTVGGLNDYLAMSNDAWNGVSDSWGEAGDAANEANKKAQGFSGQLQIMKNNAQTAGAEIAEGFTPYLNVANGALQNVTSAVSGMSQEQKTAIVTIGSAVAAAGPLLVALSSIHNGYQIAQTAMAATKIAAAVSSTAMGGAAAASGGLAAANGALAASFGPIAIGAGLAVVAIGAIAIACADNAKRMQEEHELADGLGDSLSALRQSASDAADGFSVSAQTMADAWDRTKDSVDAYRDAHQKTIDQVESSRQVVQEAADEYETTVTSLERAKKVIEEYTGKTNLSTAQQMEFESAIDTVNQACGTQLTVLDDSTGHFRDEQTGVENDTQAIYNYVKAKEYAAKADAIGTTKGEADKTYAQTLQEEVKAIDSVKNAYQSAAPILQDYFDKYGYGKQAVEEFYKDNHSAEDQQKVSTYTQQANALKDVAERTRTAAQSSDEYAQMQAALEKASTGAEMSLADLALASDATTAAFLEDGSKASLSATKFAATLQDVVAQGGGNIDKLKQAMDDPATMARIVNAYDGTAESLKGVFAELGIGFDETKAQAEDMAITAEGLADKLANSLDPQQYAAVTGAMGMSLDELGQHLLDAGVSFETLNSVSSAQFAALAANCGGDADLLAQKLLTLQNVQIGDKSFKVTDDGTLIDEDGKIEDFKAVTIDNKTYAVTDDGTIAWQEGQVQDLQVMKILGKTYYVSDNGTIYDNKGRVQDLSRLGVNSKYYSVSDNGTTKLNEDKVNELKRIKVDDKWFSIRANNYANGVIQSVKDKLASLGGDRTINIRARYTTIHDRASATGSIASAKYIPRHADGYIATGPTLTNNGWVGEAGDEAVVNWATGGAVVPLTNTRYMLPIAKAIAKEMGGKPANVYNVTVDGRQVDADQQIKQAIDVLVSSARRTAAARG